MKAIKVVLAIIGFIALAVIMFFAATTASRREEAYAKEMNDHVIRTWENTPKEFEGHECEYGDWCTQSYYEHLKKASKAK